MGPFPAVELGLRRKGGRRIVDGQAAVKRRLGLLTRWPLYCVVPGKTRKLCKEQRLHQTRSIVYHRVTLSGTALATEELLGPISILRRYDLCFFGIVRARGRSLL